MHNSTPGLHRGGIINKLAFLPEEDSLKLVSTAEDHIIKVWDLVMKIEVACLEAKSNKKGIQ